MRVLVAAPYPPARDGIAAFAVQSVARRLQDGDEVEVASPGPSAAHLDLGPKGWTALVRLARSARRYDQVTLHYHPDTWFPRGRAGRLAAAVALRSLLSRSNVEVIVHEADPGAGRGPGPVARVLRSAMQAAARLVVFTDVQRDDLVDSYGVDPTHIRVTPHGRDFSRHASDDRLTARRALGLAADVPLAVCIGFLSAHKGFDRAIKAFAAQNLGRDGGARLYVVGSVRSDDAAVVAHAASLRAAAAATEGVELHEGYVSDAEFDRWIIASDVVVLPYRQIWSSSVLERAALLQRPAIVTDVGGLAQQHPDTVTVVTDDAELAEALRRHLRGGDAPSSAPGPSDRLDVPVGTGDGVAAAQQRIEERAAIRRGGSPAPRRSGLTVLDPLPIPDPGHGPRAMVKRVVRRLTSWQVDPIVARVNELHRAALTQPDEPVDDDH